MSDEQSLSKKYRISTPTNLDYKTPIMVIEDQSDLRLIVVHQLRKLNYSNVLQASNGYDAIERLRERESEQQVGAFICDMDMPVMGGLDFLAELRESTDLDRPPFCITMDQVSKEKIMLAVENGCESILVKPFTLGDIRPKLLEAFRKYHNPNNPEKLYEAAKRALRAEKFELSQAIYNDLAKNAPKAARPIVGLSRLAKREGDNDKALKLLELAEQKNPNYVHLYAEKGKIYVEKQEWDLAVNAFRQAIKLSPLNAFRYKEAADALFQVKQYSEAIELLSSAIEHELSFPDLFHYLSQAHFHLKDYKLAAKYVRSALSTDPENITYLNQLGICLKEEGLIDEAQKAYNQIIKLDPKNVPAMYNKAILLKSRGKKDDAIKLLDRIIRQHPDFAPAQAKRDEFEKEETAGAA